MGTVFDFEVACFYIRFPSSDLYRAIYVSERTVRELANQISRKAHIPVQGIFHGISGTIKLPVDDDFVRQLPDGQDLEAEFIGHFHFDDGFVEVVLR